jgi:alpha-L-rhamnosidase
MSQAIQHSPLIAAILLALGFGVGVSAHARAQMAPPPAGPLDPARTAHLRRVMPSRETAQLIWTANDAAARDPKLQASVRGQNDKTAPHFFRVHFHLTRVPNVATLYIAGPRAATVYLNGKEVLRTTDDGARPKNLSVMTTSMAEALRRGQNVLAIEEVRGHSSLHTGASRTINQITYGEVLAAKVVPAAPGVDAPPLLVSNPAWRSTLTPGGENWQAPDFDDEDWAPVQSLGVLGSKRDFLQWNADAGLYAWPGYSGISNALRVFDVAPVSFRQVDGETLLDFGREVSARIKVHSRRAEATEVVASYGESPEEAVADKGYLGARRITVPPHSVAYGPKSAFRYVKIAPVTNAGWEKLTFTAEAITYPAEYRGSFTSSDPQLNRIWETAAYTARLCMQEGIWDGPKRDRGRWMGDLDVTGRTISAVFGSPATDRLLKQTMSDIIGDVPVTQDVNTIAGYSALWITGQAEFYRHSGDLVYLKGLHDRLLGLLHVMDAELNSDGLFTNPDKHKVFVDWSFGLSSDTPEARAATHLEFALAYRDAGFLLSDMGDEAAAAQYRDRALKVGAAAQQALLDKSTNTFGDRWQTNAMSVVSGVANSAERQTIWDRVLSHVGDTDAVITPYYGYYVLSAMAALDHRPEALQWMRQYWGGMLAEGATSFWEAYDPHWPKQDFHAYLEADGKRGYYVSLAHGWSSGPAAWLTEQVLGVRPTAAGFREVAIRPDLAGLQWARGAEPTPHGLLRVEIAPKSVRVVLPPGVRASVQLPFSPNAPVRLNGRPLPIRTLFFEGRPLVILDHAGTYRLETQ